ncbi:MAG TPA: amidase [Thermomicrobiales bacterium]|nr:amidase [Thermomicrobiales bacterium]
MGDELCFMSAAELRRRLVERDVSAVEAMEAHLRQIERVNPAVNAIVTLRPERAMDGARAADEALARGEPAGPLHGLPVAHKDTHLTAGIRTTWGSPIYRDFVPDQNALIVERMQAAGAIMIGKTNVPEFAAGSQTFNPVFGATRNPYDLGKTCGGSSGGAAVALACGMQPIADGSDLGGSLRNPGGYCNVVGFRPSAGRVPTWPAGNAWFDMSVQGPLARTVADVALILTAIAGPDDRCPIALDAPASDFAAPLARDFRGVRVGWSPTLGGLPVDPRTSDVLARRVPVFAELGCVVDEAEPDLRDADEIFQTLRAWDFEQGRGTLLEEHRDQIKDTVIWNTERGMALSGPDVGRAMRLRTELYARVAAWFDRFEYLLCPVSQLPPFDVTIPWPTEVAGEPMETYIDWMKSCSRVTVTGHPAISVPAGFTDDGLPVGLQIVGRRHADFAVLQLAHAFEQATNFWHRRPAVAG